MNKLKVTLKKTTTISNLMKSPEESKIIEEYLDNFCTLTGLAAVITDPYGTGLSKVINICDYCKVMRERDNGCELSDSYGSYTALNIGDTYIYTCHAGVIDLAIPIMVKGKFEGSIMAGQVRLKESSSDIQTKDPKLVKLYEQIPFMDKEQLDKSAKVLELLRNYIVERIENLNTLKQSEYDKSSILKDYIENICQALRHVDYEKGLKDLDKFIYKLDALKLSEEEAKKIKETYIKSFEHLSNLFELTKVEKVVNMVMPSTSPNKSGSYFYLTNAMPISHELINTKPSYKFYYTYYMALAFIMLKNKVFRVSEPMDYVTAYTKFNLTEKLTVKDIAKYMNLSSDYFARRFKKLFGKNYLDYVTELRLTIAKDFLSKSNLSINEIGLSLGFSDGNYFTRVFKKHENMSPKQYRETQTE